MKNIKKVKKMDVLMLILACVIMGVFGQLFMKKGMNSIGNIDLKQLFSIEMFSIVFQKYVFIGITLYIIASLLWLVVLSKVELSFAYPLISIGYIFTSILAWHFFDEKLTLIRFFGILLICSGVYLIILKV